MARDSSGQGIPSDPGDVYAPGSPGDPRSVRSGANAAETKTSAGGVSSDAFGEDQLGERAGALSLGMRLRQARQAQRRTLAETAEASGLTKGFLSKLENDQANASVASLVRLCDTLETPMGSLFEPASGSLVRAAAYPPIQFGGQGLAEYVLTPRSERRVQALISDIAPGGGSGEAYYTLPTEVEFVFVLSGKLRVDLAGASDETVILDTGDAFTFPAETQHSFHTVTDDQPARVLWVFTPALPAGNAWRGDNKNGHDHLTPREGDST